MHGETVKKRPQSLGNFYGFKNTENIRVTTVKISYKTIKIGTKL